MKTPEEKKIKEALKILLEIKREIPRTMGEPNLQLLYEDICEVIKVLNPYG